MKKDNITFNMVFSGICRPLALLTGAVYISFAMSYLGVEKYGIWATILSILSWIGYFDIGIGNGLRNKLTEAITKKEREKGICLVSSAYAIISMIMAAVFLLLLAAAFLIDWTRLFGTKQEGITDLLILSVFFVCVNFIFSVCKSVLYALQKAAIVGLMELLTQLVNLFGLIAFSGYIKENLMLVAFVYGFSMSLVSLGTNIILYIKYNFLCPRLKRINVKTGMELANLGIKFFIIQICALVLFTTDNILVSYFYGAAAVTPYSTVVNLFAAIGQVFAAFIAPVWSRVTKEKTEGNLKAIRDILGKLYLLMIPFAIGSIVLFLLFKPVAFIWLRQELYYEHELIFLGMVYCIISNWCNAYAYVMNGIGDMKFPMLIAIIQAVSNLPLSVFFAEGLGLKSTGVLLGTVCSMVIGAVLEPVYVYGRMRKWGK